MCTEFRFLLKLMVKGEGGQGCCYCSTKACGHIKSLSSRRAEGKLANNSRPSQRRPTKSDWVHISKGVCACFRTYQRERDRESLTSGFAFRQQENHTGARDFGIIGKVLWEMPGWRSWGEASRSQALSLRAGSQRGVGCFSNHRRGGGSHHEWMKQQDRRLDWKQPEPVCCFKEPPFSVSVYASLHLCVIRLLAGRMISCHPQWWPSTAWMSTLSETSCLSRQHTQLETLSHFRGCKDKHTFTHTSICIRLSMHMLSFDPSQWFMAAALIKSN